MNDDADAYASYRLAPSLDTVMGSVAIPVLSFLPLGAVFGGKAGFVLVSKGWREYAYESVSQRSILSFSSSPHLRINLCDEDLSRIISYALHGASPEAQITPSRELKVECLDLSRCHKLRGTSLAELLSRMRKLRYMSIAGSRLMGPECFQFQQEQGSEELALLPLLESIDLSGCPRFDTPGIGLTLRNVGNHIRCLELSGCSTTVNDDALRIVAELCPLLDSLALRGLKKVTEVGVGCVAHCRRRILHSLSLSYCNKVNLYILVYPALSRMVQLQEKFERGSITLDELLPPSFVGDELSDSDWNPQFYINAMQHVAETVSRVLLLLRTKAEIFHSMLKDLEKKFVSATQVDRITTDDDDVLFGRLEKLDLGLVQNLSTTDGYFGGCLSAIVWSSGGRLKEVNLSGLAVWNADLLLLGATSNTRLKTLDASMCTRHGVSSFSTSALEKMLQTTRGISELNLSMALTSTERPRTLFTATNTNLRILNLDHSDINNGDISAIADSYPKLVYVRLGCYQVTSDAIDAEFRCLVELLELDASSCKETKPWSQVRKSFPRLLKFNGRRTGNGKALLDRYLSYSGQRNCSTYAEKRKRKRGNNQLDSSGSSSSGATANFTAQMTKFCSMQWTGLDRNLAEQEMWACWTCNIASGRFICSSCVSECHKGHDVVACGTSTGFCDCSILGSCVCFHRKDAEETERDPVEGTKTITS